jgi:hypothetical protein
VLSPQKHIFLILFTWLCLSGYSQNATISGIVKTNDGEPIENITVAVLEDAKLSTISDSKGNYSIEVPANKEI